jgi:hypothetical protein
VALAWLYRCSHPLWRPQSEGGEVERLTPVKFLTGVRSEEGDYLQANAFRDRSISHGSIVRSGHSAIFSWIAVFGMPFDQA